MSANLTVGDEDGAGDQHKRTWRDWRLAQGVAPDDVDLEAEPYLTRAELLERVEALGLPMSERMLRNWEYEGALPRPERRWHEGMHSVQTVYPAWMPHLVLIAFEIHRDRMIPVSELGPWVAMQLNRAVLLTLTQSDDGALTDLMEGLFLDIVRQYKREGTDGYWEGAVAVMAPERVSDLEVRDFMLKPRVLKTE